MSCFSHSVPQSTSNFAIDVDVPHPLDFFPWGEALNPGPVDSDDDSIWFSFSNPSGLRSKESHLIDFGPGVHSCSETQLSSVTQPSCSNQLRALGRQQDRNLRVHLGAPAPLRSNSDWAGSWTGVATVSDFPSQEVRLPYPAERACGRLLVTQHFIGSVKFLHTVIYGYPPGPTWPHAKALTSSLLEVITNEIVLGAQGPRLVGGDFNLGPHDSPQFDLWRRLGWCSAQDLGFQLWGVEPVPTCKGQTERDLVWLSPEAASICRAVTVRDVFREHSTISVGLSLSLTSSMVRVWPLPSKIPWSQVHDSWQSSEACPLDNDLDVDHRWAQWANNWETSLDSYVVGQPGESLGAGQKGRLQRFAPTLRTSQVSCVKPGRAGDVQLRHDLIGTEVRLWFKQLRRLQSMVAATRCPKDTISAMTYRLELWSSILRASGFRGGFRHFWTFHRAVTLPESPTCLPSGPPDFPLAIAIFETFRSCFESLESWHIRQRTRLLRAKYDANHAAVFQDLRPPTRPQLDLLEVTHEYEILAVDVDTCQVHVNPPIDVRGCSRWLVDDVPVAILLDEDQPALCTIPSSDLISLNSTLIQYQTLTDTASIHDDLLTYWRKTWCALSEVDPAVWVRIVGFFRAFVPQFSFAIPPLSLAMWKKGLRRFKKTAARGVDGISPVDLLSLPDSWSLQLLELLHRVEQGLDTWPTAVLDGVVNLLAKDDDSCTIPRFRPVVVFSVIYRAWASIRAKQLLRQLHTVMDNDAYGFLPGSEPAQLWMLLQADIELCLQHDSPLCGLSVDLVRAFNFIPRQHSFALAEHLGVPDVVLRPWKSFLGGCTRAFRIHETLSKATTSCCGMPEGDALSVYAMVQLNFVWHIYQKQFCPSVRACSFVDNLSLTASRPSELASGYMCLTSFFELWNLQIDLDKSHCWALTSDDRRLLQRFPMKLVYSAPELGGSLSYSKRTGHGLQAQRCNRLVSRWLRLAKSMAPVSHKVRALYTVFWPACLHGACGTLVGDPLICSLRTLAMKHLKFHKAGTNPYLCLSLCDSPMADPGCWLLHYTVTTFRRLARKEPVLAQQWGLFHSSFSGSLLAGPFSQLMCVLNQINWHVDPPYVVDHDNCRHHLLSLPCAALADLLTDAWFQYVARGVKHRKTMSDLSGLDTKLVQRLHKNLDPLQRSLLRALQTGSFCSASSQAKFDCTKESVCTLCQVKDSQFHWLSCPRYAHLRTDIPGWEPHGGAPFNAALCGHLLPSRSSFDVQLKQFLLEIPDNTLTFESEPYGDSTLQHVFTDGTAFYSDGIHSMAAWGAINASSGLVVARGHVPGLLQTSDRAELLGATAALQWQAFHRCSLCLWMDSKFVADGLEFLRNRLEVPTHWEHFDLWENLLNCIVSLGDLDCYIKWAPSHLCATKLTDPLEDWFKEWNDKVDHLVAIHNMTRSPSFQTIYDQAVNSTSSLWSTLKRLRSFYFKVAAFNQANGVDEESQLSLGSVHDVDFVEDQATFSMYSFDPDLIQNGAFSYKAFPSDFVLSILHWIQAWSVIDSKAYRLSYLELTIALARFANICFPFEIPSTGSMEMIALSDRYEKPTIAYCYSCVRSVLKSCFRFFGCDDIVFPKIAKVGIGIIVPVDGIFVAFSPSFVQQVREEAYSIFGRRHYRRCCDLARPMR